MRIVFLFIFSATFLFHALYVSYGLLYASSFSRAMCFGNAPHCNDNRTEFEVLLDIFNGFEGAVAGICLLLSIACFVLASKKRKVWT